MANCQNGERYECEVFLQYSSLVRDGQVGILGGGTGGEGAEQDAVGEEYALGRWQANRKSERKGKRQGEVFCHLAAVDTQTCRGETARS